MASVFVDVNKEDYMKALFLDVQKQNKMVSLPDTADLIHNFVMNNPTNSDSSTMNKNGFEIRNNRIVIHARH